MQRHVQDKSLRADVNVVRIKRLREDDALEALLLEDSDVAKNNSSSFKRRKFMYKRVNENDNSNIVINESTPTFDKNSDNKFIYEKGKNKRKRDEAEANDLVRGYTNDSLPTEVNSLLSDFITKETLKQNSKNPEIKKALLKNGKRLRRNQPTEETVDTSLLTSDSNGGGDYVYDIYVKEEITNDNKLFFNQSSIGYLKIVEDGTLIYDENSEAEHLSDDEDSNEEDYYKNDYPEDEDDDRSVIFGDDYDEGDGFYKERRWSGAFEDGDSNDNNCVSYDELSKNISMTNDAFGNTMNKFDRNLQAGSFLDSLNVQQEEDSDDDPSYYYTDDENKSDNEVFEGDYNFPRNHFFASDQDDPLAIYRDKIMYSLEKRLKKDK